MFEVSRLVHMNNVQVVDFEMCRFGHPDKGPIRMLTNYRWSNLMDDEFYDETTDEKFDKKKGG